MWDECQTTNSITKGLSTSDENLTEDYPIEETKSESIAKCTFFPDYAQMNLAMLYGYLPDASSEPNDELFKAVIDALTNEWCEDKLALEFPKVLEDIAAMKSNLQLYTSKDIQPLNLNYTEGVITHSIGFVFVNTFCRSVHDECKKEERT